MAVAIKDGRKVVSAAGTAERLVANEGTMCWWVMIQALRNTQYVAIGGSTVDIDATAATDRGMILGPESAATLRIDSRPGGMIDLYDIWLDSEVNDEGVSFLYGG